MKYIAVIIVCLLLYSCGTIQAAETFTVTANTQRVQTFRWDDSGNHRVLFYKIDSLERVITLGETETTLPGLYTFTVPLPIDVLRSHTTGDQYFMSRFLRDSNGNWQPFDVKGPVYVEYKQILPVIVK